MTDKELHEILKLSRPRFKNSLRFNAPNFNNWVVASGNKHRRPVFSRKNSYKSRKSLAAIVDDYVTNLIEESVKYPISIVVKGLGSLEIYETKLLGRRRNILTDDGYITCIDDYINNSPAHWIVGKRPPLHSNRHILSFEFNKKTYRKVLRQVATLHPKGKFYQYKNIFNY